MENTYFNHDENEKCQCITFDESGNIMGSCESLFSTARITAEGIKKEFPLLRKMLDFLNRADDSSNPVFFPHVNFEFNGYHSICDFTFMKTEDAHGIKRFIMMIYDNSIHYRDLIHSGIKSKKIKY